MKKAIKKVRKYFKIEKVCQHKFDIKEVLDMNCEPKCINCHRFLNDLVGDEKQIKL